MKKQSFWPSVLILGLLLLSMEIAVATHDTARRPAAASSGTIYNRYLHPRINSCPSIKVMPKGNGPQSLIPELPAFTVARLMGSIPPINLTFSSAQERTDKVIRLGFHKIPIIMKKLAKKGVLLEIKKVSEVYGFSPATILGPIIGEQVFNSSIDTVLQDNLSHFFESDLRRVGKFYRENSLRLEPVRDCMDSTELSNYWKWRCTNFFFSTIFGDPFNLKLRKASTCGIGQFNPVLVWAFNDVVIRKSGLPRIEFGDLRTSLETVLTPTKIVHYIGAYAETISELYKNIACYDISQNPGLIGTLYNLGDEDDKANFRRQFTSEPEVNYLGWFVNYFEELINSEFTKLTSPPLKSSP